MFRTVFQGLLLQSVDLGGKSRCRQHIALVWWRLDGADRRLSTPDWTLLTQFLDFCFLFCSVLWSSGVVAILH